MFIATVLTTFMQNRSSYKDSEPFYTMSLWKESEFGKENHCFFRSYKNKLIENYIHFPHETGSEKAEMSSCIFKERLQS